MAWMCLFNIAKFSLTVCLVFFVLFFCGVGNVSAKGIGMDPGPVVLPTRGEVWPKPQHRVYLKKYMIVRPNDFKFQAVSHTCDILEGALVRYSKIIKTQERKRRMAKVDDVNVRKRDLTSSPDFVDYLGALKVDLFSPCESLPHVEMDEKYELKINSPDVPRGALLTASSIWGILRGLETFSQLLYVSDASALILNSTIIMDFPSFPHRGLLLDTSRHYLPLKTIYQNLDAMAMNKFNVLHWHLVDDHSFPYQSATFPRLSEYGAYTQKHIYTTDDVKSVIKYAAVRGIRVLPEFDTPGHTRSWGEGHPEILTQCYKKDVPDGTLGPMNPIENSTYTFMDSLLKEIKDIFPDRFVHLGGDEVDFDCWESNPNIINFITQRGISFQKLEEIYIKRLIDMASGYSFKSIVWQEVFDNGVEIPQDVVIHVWKGRRYSEELYTVISMGYTALLSSPWYLDHVSTGGDWIKFYNVDLQIVNATKEQSKRLLGGEACMWGEHVDVTNVMTRIWPRACAAAEKLWSSASTKNIQQAAKRLEEHVCRLNMRGIPTQPANGPGFCPYVNF